MKTAKGKFEIKATPIQADEISEQIGFMRMTFDKKFEGVLDAKGSVSMMGIMDRELGSGGYVAIERITGTLEGRTGTFCLQHSSLMNRNTPLQSIAVIPDTGTDDLAGITGSMTIDIVEGQHYYNFHYEL
ncbi:MAG: DUF3224 domain-containing protein [Bdellovibrionota bacterium]